MTTMDEAYRRDYAHKQLCEDARRALEAVLQSDYHGSPRCRASLEQAVTELVEACRHITAVWD